MPILFVPSAPVVLSFLLSLMAAWLSIVIFVVAFAL